MKTLDSDTSVSPEILARIQDACDRIANAIPYTQEEQVAAHQEMDRIREEIRAAHGVLDIGVPAVRQLRDGE